MDSQIQIQQLQQIVDDLKSRVTDLETPKGNFDDAAVNYFDIVGLIPSYTTSLELTQITAFPPRNIYEQIFIYTIGGVTKLYIYDTSNTSSTFSNGWHYVTLT